MKIVFLDFDGVLNSRLFFARRRETTGADDALDVAAVERVNRILARTGAKVVISSTWRVTDGMDRVREVLSKHGFVGEIVGATPTRGGTRGAEIKAWLDDNPRPTGYVVLDDATDVDPVRKRHVQTRMEDGLLDEHVDLACAMLEKSNWWPW
jgi:hypothetical protein